MDLFRTSGAVAGGFDVNGVLAVFPFVLSAAMAAGPAIEAFFSGGVTSVPGMAKDVIDLWDRYRHRTVEAAKAIPLGSEPPYRALDRVFSVIEAEVAKAGLEPDQRDLLTYRIVRHLLDDVDGTREFIDAAAKAPGH